MSKYQFFYALNTETFDIFLNTSIEVINALTIIPNPIPTNPQPVISLWKYVMIPQIIKINPNKNFITTKYRIPRKFSLFKRSTIAIIENIPLITMPIPNKMKATLTLLETEHKFSFAKHIPPDIRNMLARMILMIITIIISRIIF